MTPAMEQSEGRDPIAVVAAAAARELGDDPSTATARELVWREGLRRVSSWRDDVWDLVYLPGLMPRDAEPFAVERATGRVFGLDDATRIRPGESTEVWLSRLSP